MIQLNGFVNVWVWMRTTKFSFVKCLFAILSGNWSISNQTSICVCNKFARDKSNHFEWQVPHQLLSNLLTVCRRKLLLHVCCVPCVGLGIQCLPKILFGNMTTTSKIFVPFCISILKISMKMTSRQCRNYKIWSQSRIFHVDIFNSYGHNTNVVRLNGGGFMRERVAVTDFYYGSDTSYYTHLNTWAAM